MTDESTSAITYEVLSPLHRGARVRDVHRPDRLDRFAALADFDY
jgi:hypothetical protein